MFDFEKRQKLSDLKKIYFVVKILLKNQSLEGKELYSLHTKV